MEITCVRTNLYTNKNRLKAVASITLENCFVVHNIKVIEGEKGIFIAMPSTKNSKGMYVDIAHPINKETRQVIEDNVKKTFQEMIDSQESKTEITTNLDNKPNNFEITNVKINLYHNNTTRLRGKATITINNDFVVHGIKMIQGERSLFIAMPSTKNSKGAYIDIAHPIRQETRQIIETECKKVFQEMIENGEDKITENNQVNNTEEVL